MSMSPVSPELSAAGEVSEKLKPADHLDKNLLKKAALFVTIAVLTVGAVAGGLSITINNLEGQTSQNSQEVSSAAIVFPEVLEQPLEDWMNDQYYDQAPYYDKEPLKPLEDYAKHLYETSTNRGWIAVENNPSLEIWVGESKSPELLQESHAVLFKVNDDLRGFIWNDDGTYSLQGDGEDRVEGKMAHFSGEVEGNYIGDYGMPNQTPIDPYAPFKFLMVWKGPNKWQGWINFRGEDHQRPFGGGKDSDSFPTGGLKWQGD